MVTGDRVEFGKPHPEPYLTAAAELGLHPGQCLAIEDSNTGAKSAVAAGCTVLCVPNHVPILEGEGRVFVDSSTASTPPVSPRSWTAYAGGSADPGSGGIVPPLVGQNWWKEHQSQRRDGLGRQSPVSWARRMARHTASTFRPDRLTLVPAVGGIASRWTRRSTRPAPWSERPPAAAGIVPPLRRSRTRRRREQPVAEDGTDACSMLPGGGVIES